MNAFAIIPARGGSKGVPKKSIALLCGFPLIAYSIAAAKLSKTIARVIVSTDSEEMAEVARSFGAEAPFMRPAEFARDTSPDIEFVQHAIQWLKEHESRVPEYLVHLRPTTPLRKPEDIDRAIEMLMKHKDATSLRSGYEMRESPYKLFGIQDGYFTPLEAECPAACRGDECRTILANTGFNAPSELLTGFICKLQIEIWNFFSALFLAQKSRQSSP